MKSIAPVSYRRLAAALVVLSSVSFLGACDWLRGVSEPETVRVKIESSDVSQVTLVSSFVFAQLPDPDCPLAGCDPLIQLIDADTTTIQLPFEQTYNFNSRHQVFLESIPEEVATLAMQVFIDGESWYDDFRTVDPNAEPLPETLRFVYQFADISF